MFLNIEMFTATTTDIRFKDKKMITKCPNRFLYFSATIRALSQIIQIQLLTKLKLKIRTCVTAKRSNKSIFVFLFILFKWNFCEVKIGKVMLAPSWKRCGIGS